MDGCHRGETERNANELTIQFRHSPLLRRGETGCETGDTSFPSSEPVLASVKSAGSAACFKYTA